MRLAALKPAIAYGVTDLSRLDTTPGAVCFAAPPEDVGDYRAWLRAQYTTNRDVHQHFDVALTLWRQGDGVAIGGPYALALTRILVSAAARYETRRTQRVMPVTL